MLVDGLGEGEAVVLGLLPPEVHSHVVLGVSVVEAGLVPAAVASQPAQSPHHRGRAVLEDLAVAGVGGGEQRLAVGDHGHAVDPGKKERKQVKPGLMLVGLISF